MTERDAFRLAEKFKQLVFTRTGIARDQLVCPREKSFMTPCIARDGSLAVAGPVHPWGLRSVSPVYLCVGCERRVQELVDDERQRAKPEGTA